VALQVLFQIEVGKAGPEEVFRRTIEEFGVPEKALGFSRRLVFGTIEHLSAVDGVIARISRDWDLKRMANVDKSIMRMALFEILYCDDIPDSVSVNEAIELAKIYGGDESGRFVNGILGKVVEDPVAYKP
jgi:N utilization substance protein B